MAQHDEIEKGDVVKIKDGKYEGDIAKVIGTTKEKPQVEILCDLKYGWKPTPTRHGRRWEAGSGRWESKRARERAEPQAATASPVENVPAHIIGKLAKLNVYC